MRRTIRLNESELKQMIAESIKKTLNELDWKTYMNAGKKDLLKEVRNLLMVMIPCIKQKGHLTKNMVQMLFSFKRFKYWRD